jgi:hypothetical protein
MKFSEVLFCATTQHTRRRPLDIKGDLEHINFLLFAQIALPLPLIFFVWDEFSFHVNPYFGLKL